MVIYGKSEEVSPALRNTALRNTVHAMYLVAEGVNVGEHGRKVKPGNASLIKTGEYSFKVIIVRVS